MTQDVFFFVVLMATARCMLDVGHAPSVFGRKIKDFVSGSYLKQSDGSSRPMVLLMGYKNWLCLDISIFTQLVGGGHPS